MAKPRQIGKIAKIGSCVGLILSKQMQARLGWNYADAVTLDVIEGSLVVTKVQLPAPPGHLPGARVATEHE